MLKLRNNVPLLALRPVNSYFPENSAVNTHKSVPSNGEDQGLQ